MDNIIEATVDYDFSKLYLGPPNTVSGGAYFTRLMHNTNKPLYVQTPKSLTKQGFVKSGKKVYTDLMFDNNDTVFIVILFIFLLLLLWNLLFHNFI